MFNSNFPSHTYLTSQTWIIFLLEFVCEHDIALSISSIRRPQPFCTHDKVLVDIFQQEHTSSPKLLRSVNQMQCYLEDFSLADIGTGDATKLH